MLLSAINNPSLFAGFNRPMPNILSPETTPTTAQPAPVSPTAPSTAGAVARALTPSATPATPAPPAPPAPVSGQPEAFNYGDSVAQRVATAADAHDIAAAQALQSQGTPLQASGVLPNGQDAAAAVPNGQGAAGPQGAQGGGLTGLLKKIANMYMSGGFG
jgi:hypothetical protein